MFHELQVPGRPVVDDQPGYLRYVVHEATFSRHLRAMSEQQLHGVAVGAAWDSAGPDGCVVLTFDDGCETDWTVAAPLLSALGLGATFYVVSGWIGRRGFMDTRQLRELHAAGFEIGSHSASHAFFNDLDEGALRHEIADSRRAIEDILGDRVRHLSCPGGRATRRAARVAEESGYETMATSCIGRNDTSTDRYALARCAVMADTTPARFAALCRGRGLRRLRARQQLLTGARRLVGNRLYAGLRQYALRHS